MSEEARRDNSGVPVGLGSDGTTTKQLRVDSATNRLLIAIDIVSDVAAPSFPITAPRDNSQNPVSMAVTDDANETPRPLIIDSRNGYLFVDVLVE